MRQTREHLHVGGEMIKSPDVSMYFTFEEKPLDYSSHVGLAECLLSTVEGLGIFQVSINWST